MKNLQDPHKTPQTPPRQCPFCDVPENRIVASNHIAFAMRDAFPVSAGHTLIIPFRHIRTWFEASADEQRAIMDLAEKAKRDLDREHQPSGYNIGINVGPDAGQTVMHLHLHLIPRYPGDVDDPTGGVRYVIPSRGNYQRKGHIAQARDARKYDPRRHDA